MSSFEGSSVTFLRVPATVRRAAIERFARRLEDEVTQGAAFDVLITGDTELRRLNQKFRNKDYATDVLSFPPASPGARLGDLAISLARARAQAREFGHPIEREIQILMLHGVLHLMGHDHEIDGGEMARLEKRWRAKLGLPCGLIERVQS